MIIKMRAESASREAKNTRLFDPPVDVAGESGHGFGEPVPF
jgi:hypothetical protein